VREEINSFLNYLAVEKGFSENTLAAYQNDLHQLASFAEEEATKQGFMPSWADLGRQGILSYLLNLKERNYAATTVARKVAAAKFRNCYAIKMRQPFFSTPAGTD